MRVIKIYNKSGAEGTWCGVTIQNNDFYQLQVGEDLQWGADSTVVSDIGSEDLVVNDGDSDLDVNSGVDWLKGTVNYLLGPTDIDGARISRIKASNLGWIYNLIPIEFTTSDLDSVYSKLDDGTDRSGVTLKLYDSSDDEITSEENEGNAVKTIVDFEPPYDYEIIGGSCRQKSTPSGDIRVWVTAAPDIPASSGGSIPMIGGVNMSYIDPGDQVTADGRASTFLSYSETYHSNKMRVIIKHGAGDSHDIMVVLETFRNKIVS